MELHEQLESVTDEKTFLAFAHALLLDRVAAVKAESSVESPPFERDPGGWENTSIHSFLEAAIAWAESSQFGTTQGLSLENPWKKFAVFLYCGKIYE